MSIEIEEEYFLEVDYNSTYDAEEVEEMDVEWETLESRIKEMEEVEEIETITEIPNKSLFVDLGESGVAMSKTRVIFRRKGSQESIKKYSKVISTIISEFSSHSEPKARFEGEVSINRKISADVDAVLDLFTKDFDPADDYGIVEFRTFNNGDILDDDEFLGFLTSIQRLDHQEDEMLLKSYVKGKYPADEEEEIEDNNLAGNSSLDNIIQNLIVGNQHIYSKIEERL